ncbi:MAG: hypothetical protein ACFFB0_19235 [Promethearchaeota archaeon]
MNLKIPGLASLHMPVISTICSSVSASTMIIPQLSEVLTFHAISFIIVIFK